MRAAIHELAPQRHVHVCSDASVMSDSSTPWACQAPLSMRCSRQEYLSGVPCPSPWDPPNPGIEPTSLVSPALQADSLSTELPGNTHSCILNG